MKTLQEILDNYEKYKTFLEDRLGRRLCDFLTEEQAKKIGFELKEGYEWPTPKEWTKENILEQLRSDVDFGFEKALNQRGISSSLMFSVIQGWNMILEDGLEGWPDNDYAQYGLPLFKATAEKYGWDNPIGSDTGREFKYGIDEYWLDELCIPSLYYINDNLGILTTASREGVYKGKELDSWNKPGVKNPYLEFYKDTPFIDFLSSKISGSEVEGKRILFPIKNTKEELVDFWNKILEIAKEYGKINSSSNPS